MTIKKTLVSGQLTECGNGVAASANASLAKPVQFRPTSD